MVPSDYFYSRTRKSLKKAGSKEEFFSSLKKAFFKGLTDYPYEMGVEICEYFIQKYGEKPPGVILDKLTNVVELFNEEYLDHSSSLEPEDWDLLKEMMDEFALELDEDIIMYIMQRVLDNGRL